MSTDITNWLRGLGLEQYATAFLENNIDVEILPKLTADSAAAIYDALYRSMLDAKIADPLSKLHVSNIPLRSAPNG